jgi:hypothetical protein
VLFPSRRVDRTWLRFWIVLTLGLWIVSNLAPCAQVIEASRYATRSVEAMRGFRLTLLGWLGPLALSFAWYANISYFYCVWRLFGGHASLRAALIGFCLALTALLPHAMYSEVDGWHRAYIAGPALWLWLSAFASNLVLAGMLGRKSVQGLG